MPPSALAIVLGAAVLHAIWNYLAKDARDTSAFMWWGIAVGALWYGAWVLSREPLALPQAAWGVFAASLVAELGYLAVITRGYASGDLSQVYPIARGSPPLFIALWSGLFLAERLPVLGYVGIGLVVVGVYVAGLPRIGDLFRPLSALSHRPAQLALVAGVFVSIYTTLDKIGVSYTSPAVYNWWVYAGIAVGYAPAVWFGQRRASAIQEWRSNWPRILVGSVATIGSYLLALAGMAITAASYVGAVRASSVIIGALLGWLLLKERFGAARVIAAATMVAGLALLALAR